MPAQKIVRTRKGGYCDLEFAHDGRIEPGDIILVETVFPRSELTQFGIEPWTRFRTCKWCLERRMSETYTRIRTNPSLVKQWYEMTKFEQPEDD